MTLLITQENVLMNGACGAIADNVMARLQDGKTFKKFFDRKDKIFLDDDFIEAKCRAKQTFEYGGDSWYTMDVSANGFLHNDNIHPTKSFHAVPSCTVHEFSSNVRTSTTHRFRNKVVEIENGDGRDWNHASYILDSARRTADFAIASAFAHEWLMGGEGEPPVDFDKHMVIVEKDDIVASLKKRKNGEDVTIKDLGMPYGHRPETVEERDAKYEKWLVESGKKKAA